MRRGLGSECTDLVLDAPKVPLDLRMAAQSAMRANACVPLPSFGGHVVSWNREAPELVERAGLERRQEHPGGGCEPVP